MGTTVLRLPDRIMTGRVVRAFVSHVYGVTIPKSEAIAIAWGVTLHVRDVRDLPEDLVRAEERGELVRRIEEFLRDGCP